MKKNKFLILVLIYLVGVIYVPVIGMDELAKEKDVLPIEPDLIPFESLPIIEPPVEIEEVNSNEFIEKGIDESPFYYYYDNKRVNLIPNSNMFSFFTNLPDAAEKKSGSDLKFDDLIPKKNIKYIDEYNLALVKIEDTTIGDQFQQNYLQSKSTSIPVTMLPVFGSEENLAIITDQFIVKCKEGFGVSDLEKLNKTHHVEIIKKIDFISGAYLLRVLQTEIMDGLKLANLYFETGKFEYAEPNFLLISKDPINDSFAKETGSSVGSPLNNQYFPNDPYFYNQWFLHNVGHLFSYELKNDADIDAPEAWGIYRYPWYSHIAIVDDGVEKDHEDLSGRIYRGYSTGNLGGAGEPISTDNNHGTPVAGLVGANQDNYIQGSGVCWGCKLSSIMIDYDLSTYLNFAEAIANAYQNGDDIINCSWHLYNDSSVVANTIQNAVTQGRDGRGSIVIASAGNHKADSTILENNLVFPAKLNTVISVAASNGCDERKVKIYNGCNFESGKWSSHYGAGLDISAPGVFLRTTDRTDTLGYTDSNYTYFSGTSGSAPIVSAVVGLMLGKNPLLRNKQVQYFLEQSADDIGPAGKDIYTGSGRVNAFKALAATLQTKNRYYDFNGNGVPDISLFRPNDGKWYTYGSPSVAYGMKGDIPVAGDYNSDGLTEIAVFRPSNGVWYIRGYQNIPFGRSGDIPVPADYADRGRSEIAVFRPSNGTWYIRGLGEIQYGMAGDIPVPADYDGDGYADIAVYRPSSGSWYLNNVGVFNYGQPGDIPVPTDYNGDGKADIAVFRPSTGTWHLRNIVTVSFGTSGDIPIPFDYDGNGSSEITVFRPSNGTWYIRNRGQIKYGAGGDIPVYRFSCHATTIYAKTAENVNMLVDGQIDPQTEFFDPATMEKSLAELNLNTYVVDEAEMSDSKKEKNQEVLAGFKPLDMNVVNLPKDATTLQNGSESGGVNPTLDSKQINFEPGNFNQWYYIHRENLVLPSTGFPTKRSK